MVLNWLQKLWSCTHKITNEISAFGRNNFTGTDPVYYFKRQIRQQRILSNTRWSPVAIFLLIMQSNVHYIIKNKQEKVE